MSNKRYELEKPILIAALKKSYMTSTEIKTLLKMESDHIAYRYVCSLSKAYPIAQVGAKFKILTAADYAEYEDAHRNKEYEKAAKEYDWV